MSDHEYEYEEDNESKPRMTFAQIVLSILLFGVVTVIGLIVMVYFKLTSPAERPILDNVAASSPDIIVQKMSPNGKVAENVAMAASATNNPAQPANPDGSSNPNQNNPNSPQFSPNHKMTDEEIAANVREKKRRYAYSESRSVDDVMRQMDNNMAGVNTNTMPTQKSAPKRKYRPRPVEDSDNSNYAYKQPRKKQRQNNYADESSGENTRRSSSRSYAERAPRETPERELKPRELKPIQSSPSRAESQGERALQPASKGRSGSSQAIDSLF